MRGHEGRKLAIEAEAADWKPRCLCECGFLPAPSPEDCPPAPPHEVNCGKPRQKRFPGKYPVYTDASAMRPKDPYLRRAACAFWAGDSKTDSAAWSFPGPVQTVYRAELFAILVALEVFRGEVEIVSDWKGFVDEAERIRAGGRVSPTSRHADLWFRYKNALSAEGLGRVLVHWVPSHEKEDSDRTFPEDRNGNDQADRLANALAKRIGPTAIQGKIYDRRVRQMMAIQGIKLKILTASQASGRPGHRIGPSVAQVRLGGAATARPAPGNATSPPWSPGSCECGGPTSLPPMAQRVTGASLAPGWLTTRGPGMRLSTSRARAVVALGALPGHAGPGSSGAGRMKPGGGAKGRAATKPSGTIPPSTTVGGFA